MSKVVKNYVVLIQQAVNEAAKRRADALGYKSMWRPEHLQAELDKINAALEAQVAEYKGKAAEAVEAARAQLEVSFYQAAQAAGPQTPGEWQEAAARASFVAADIEGLDGAGILDYYKLASSAGDKLGAWAIQRAGLRKLDALAHDADDLMRAAYARQAGDELHRLAYGEAYTQRKTALAELVNLEGELKRPVTPGEQAGYRKHIADAMGVKAELVPLPE